MAVFIFKASQPRGRASGSHACEGHEMQGVIFKCTRHECSVFVKLKPLLLRIRGRHQFSSLEKKRLPLYKTVNTGKYGHRDTCTDSTSASTLLGYVSFGVPFLL